MAWFKKLMIFLGAVTVFSMAGGLVVQPVYAQVDPLDDACQGRAASSPACQDDNRNPLYGPDGVITRVTQLLVYVVGLASVITIIIAGFKYVTSAGEGSKTANAKDTIMYALIGVAVALLAQAIVSFVLMRIN